MRTRIGVVVLAATIPLVALALDPSGWFPFGPSKWMVVSTLVPAGAALVLWHRRPRLERPLMLAFVLLIAWLSVAAFVGHDSLYAWIGTPERHFGVLTWLLCGLALIAGPAFDERDRLDTLAPALAVAALGAGAFATAEAFGFEPSVFAVTAGRLTATMGSAAYLGALGALLLPVAVGAACDRDVHRNVRLIAAAAVIPITVAVLGSGARAAWFGLVAAAAVFLVVHHQRVRTVVAGLSVVALVVFVSPVGGRLSSITDADQAGGRSRLDEWRVAARVIAKHPLTGVGPEGYRIAFAEGVDDQYEKDYGRATLPDRAHSAPLDVALAGGLPALAAWAVVIGLMFRAAVRALRSERWFMVGLGAALVAHYIGQLLLFPIAELEPIAWLLGGVLLSSSVRKTSSAVTRQVALALGAVMVVALVAGVRDVTADRHANNAAQALSKGATREAVAQATMAVDARPDEVRLHLLLAQSLQADQRGTRAALAAVDDALDIAPNDPIARRLRAEVLIDRASATRLPLDIEAARQSTSELVGRDPHNARYWQLSGLAAQLDGDTGAATASFARAAELGG